MAKVNRPDGSLVSGKLSKKSKKVHRIRNGAETTYEMEYYSGPASKAQKAARSLHAKICAVLNPLMSDPEQVKALEAQMKEYNSRHPLDKFLTVRQYAYEQIKRSLLDRNHVAAAKADAKTPLPRGLKMYIKPFAELSAAEIYEILKARFSVFVLEQGIMYLDEDNIDYTATHLAQCSRSNMAKATDEYFSPVSLPKPNVRALISSAFMRKWMPCRSIGTSDLPRLANLSSKQVFPTSSWSENLLLPNAKNRRLLTIAYCFSRVNAYKKHLFARKIKKSLHICKIFSIFVA